MSATGTNLKAWAREHLKGVENTLFPSFSPDLKHLDEDGIRWDVRQSIAHGFFSMMCATETGLTLDEAKRFVAIAADEARDRIVVTTSLILNNFDENMELMEHAEKAGVRGVLLGYPPTFHPDDEEVIFTVTKRFSDATKMHITLYPSPHFNFTRFHPSGFPPNVLVRLAELPNVVAMKVGEMGLFADVHRLVGDKLLVGCPVERYVPLLIKGFDMQWMGAGCYEVFQSPDKPYLVEYFNLLLQGKVEPAMELYWKLAPMRNIFEQQFNQTVMSGTYNWHQQKFYQWCVGGNGGLTRQPAMKLHPWEADAIRMGFYAIDIPVREPEEEFWVGRVNYAKMHGGQDGKPVDEKPTDSRPSLSTVSSDSGVQPDGLYPRFAQVVRDTRDELGTVPAMIRPMVRHALKSKTGSSIDEWMRTAEELEDAVRKQSAGGEAHLPQDTPELRERLERLASYFHDAPAETAKRSRDPQVIEQVRERMAAREEVVLSLVTYIESL
ncbi:MAG: hypothetical protein GF331_05560 [Chitinivibrionales bacterium]|nr:hypothetical protein [Chitinivibrionales bacterium]